MASDTVIANCAATTRMMLGRMWAQTIQDARPPSARAASTNNDSRMFMT